MNRNLEPEFDINKTKVWLLDLDGVIWRGNRYIERSIEALVKLQDSGRRLVFFTNNSFITIDELSSRLNVGDLKVQKEDILTSSMAACRLLNPRDEVFYIGGDGIKQAIKDRGAFGSSVSDLIPDRLSFNEINYNTVFDFIKQYGNNDRFKVVLVGLSFKISYLDVALAVNLIKNGSEFIATNNDSTYPVQLGLEIPGAGSAVASIEYASSKKPIIAGKPNELAVELIQSCIENDNLEMVVGDRYSTDGKLAGALNANFGFVASGVKEDPKAHNIAISYSCIDLFELVDEVLRNPTDA